MPVFRTSNILFIHIPKTAGTSIEKALYHREPPDQRITTISFYGIEPPTWDNHQGYSLQHYTYKDLYETMDVANFRLIFTVVRNPYHRLVSAFYFYHGYIANE